MLELTVSIHAQLAARAGSDASRHAAVVQRIWAADGPLIDPPTADASRARTSQRADPLLARFPRVPAS
jgi:hypothetical protein